MKTFSWLHITDLHLGLDKTKFLWPNIQDEFFDDLKHVLTLAPPIDLVVFSGDLTQSGQKLEFQQLEEMLGKLWSLFRDCGQVPRLLAVPGNHDLERPDEQDPAGRILSQWSQQEAIHENFWLNASSAYRAILNAAFQRYTDWWSTTAIPKVETSPGLLPGEFTASVRSSTGEISVGLIGLNTAGLHLFPGDYEGKLALHASQFRGADNGDIPTWCRKHDYNFLVSHHPPSWLDRTSRDLLLEINSPGRFVAHLCGHLHEPRAEYSQVGGAQATRLIQGRSLFGVYRFLSSGVPKERAHGYSVGAIKVAEGKAELELWPREARRTQAGQWQLQQDGSFALDRRSQSTTADLLAASTKPPDFPPKSSASAEARLPAVSPPTNIIEDTVTADAARERLSRLLVPIDVAPNHLAIRGSERLEARQVLERERVLIVAADWGMGQDQFVRSLFVEYPNFGEKRVYRVAVEGATSFELFDEEFRKQSGFSLQSFCVNVGALGACCVVLDGLEFAPGENNSWLVHVVEFAKTLLDLAAGTMVIITTRSIELGVPFQRILLGPLEEPDCAKYVEAHVNGGRRIATPAAVEKLFDLSRGVPAQLNRLLSDLQSVSLSELTEFTDTPREQDDVPAALVEAVRRVLGFGDKYGKRTARLLQLLSILPQGESLDVIRRFDNAEPFFPDNAEQLRRLRLLDVVELPSDTFLSSSTEESTKILVVPLQVREYVASGMTEADRQRLLKGCLDLYFGDKWRDGSVSFPRSVRPRQLDGRTALMPNQAVVVRSLTREALRTGDAQQVVAYARLAIAFFESLQDAFRFRELESSSAAFYALLRHTSFDEQVAKTCRYYGGSLRMLGRSSEATPLLREALRRAPKDIGDAWRSMAHNVLGLAELQLGNYDEAEVQAAACIKISEKNNIYQQAQVLRISARSAGKRPSTEDLAALRDIEEKCRKKAYDTVANNIALQLARWDTDDVTRVARYSSVIATSDAYNRLVAIVSKAEYHLKDPDRVKLARGEILLLHEAYSYLFSQRMSSLFERCHDAVWRLEERGLRVSILVRLFRLGSIVWRVWGRADRERKFVESLAPHVQSATEARELSPGELSYFRKREIVVNEPVVDIPPQGG